MEKYSVQIRMHTVSSSPGYQTQDNELITYGTYIYTPQKQIISYTEDSENGFEGHRATIHVTKEEVVFSRYGTYGGKMHIVTGDTTLYDYKTPYGQLPLSVKGLQLKNGLTPAGGTLKLSFLLTDTPANPAIKNTLTITIKKRNEE